MSRLLPFLIRGNLANSNGLGMLWLMMLLVNFWVGQIAQVQAADSISHVFPVARNGLPTFTTKSGLRISVDSDLFGKRGYRPVKVTIDSATPVTGDTQITFRLTANVSPFQSSPVAVEQDFTLPLGASSASTEILLPQYDDLYMLSYEVWVDGRKDNEFSQGTYIGVNSSQSVGPTALFFKPKDTVLPRLFRNTEQLDTVTRNSSSLFDDWKHYSTFDIVFAYPEDLKRWDTTSPAKFQHLLRWVRAGGNLWVVESGQEFEKLKGIESTVKLAPVDSEDINARGWNYLPFSSDSQVDGALSVVHLEGLLKNAPPEQDAPKDKAGNDLVASSKNFFVSRAYGLGTVVAFANTIGIDLVYKRPTVTAVYQTALSDRLDWASRHGNDPGLGNFDFGRFLIPDVGMAPVLAFQLLISLFIIGIGPVNYWLLRRRHKLPFMLLTVPLAALVTTLVLFVYGFVADGISVRLRAHSFTHLDQKLGEATSWARLSYYAGVAPADGLTIPNDTLFYPINPYRSGNQSVRQPERELYWANNQRLSKGWLASRTPMQYLSIAARQSSRKILFDSTSEGMTATNQLDSDITALVVRDHDGNYHLGDVIENEQSVTLRRTEITDANIELRTLVTDNEPEFPPGLEVAQSRRQRNRFGQWQEVLNEKSLLDDYFNSLISPMSSGLAPGTYVAITTHAPEVSFGLDGAIESASFHVIRGTWADD